MKFTEAEILALKMAKNSLLTSKVNGKTESDCFGYVEMPGLRVWRKLIKGGFILETEEDPIDVDDDDGVTFTSSFELTEEGKDALASLNI